MVMVTRASVVTAAAFSSSFPLTSPLPRPGIREGSRTMTTLPPATTPASRRGQPPSEARTLGETGRDWAMNMAVVPMIAAQWWIVVTGIPVTAMS